MKLVLAFCAPALASALVAGPPINCYDYVLGEPVSANETERSPVLINDMGSCCDHCNADSACNAYWYQGNMQPGQKFDCWMYTRIGGVNKSGLGLIGGDSGIDIDGRATLGAALSPK